MNYRDGISQPEIDSKLNSHLYSQLMMHLDTVTKGAVRNKVAFGDGIGVWKALNERFTSDNRLHIKNIRRQMESVKYDSIQGDIDKFLSDIYTYAARISSITHEEV